jgi:hypothetical protein
VTTINKLPLLPTLIDGDLFVVWSIENGDSRRVPYSTIKADTRAGLMTLTEPGTFANKTFNLNNNTLIGTLSQFNAACTDADFVSVAALAASTGSSTVGFLQAGAGAVLQTTQAKLRQYVSAADFGAVGAPLGTTPPDETAALTAFFNSANANPGVEHRLAQRAYGISAALPTINQSGVKIYGSGQSTVHNVGQVFSGTTIFWLGGAATAVMQTIAPTAGASNQHLSGITYYGVSFNCASAVTQGVVIRSVRSSLIGIGVANATTTGVVLGVLATGSLGENESLQTNDIYLSLRQVDGAGANGVPLRLQGSSTANVSLNRFRMVEIIHGNTSAVIEENADNNIWEEFRSFATGSATYSVEWQGAAIEADSCRAELFDKFSANKPVLAHGTGTYTYPSTNNIINSLDADNATPLPVYGTSATGFWRDTRGIFGGSSGGILAEKAALGDNITTALAARTRLGTSTVHIVNDSTDHAQFSDAANTNRWGVSIDGSGNFRFVRLAGTGSVNLPSQSSFNGGAITLGAADSAGVGFRTMRVPN